MLKIVIADDHPLFRDAIRLALDDLAAPDGLTIFEASSADDAKDLARSHHDLDLMLLDLRMPGMNGLGGLVDLRKRHPSLPIAIVSASDDPRVMRDCLDLGAMGFVPKSYQKAAIADAIRDVLEGRVHQPPSIEASAMPVENDDDETEITQAIQTLTPQQLRVLQAIARGQPNKIIAYELGIAEKTVKAHVTVILKKLAVTNRTQAVLAVRHLFGP